VHPAPAVKRITLLQDPTNVRVARKFVEESLVEHGLGDLVDLTSWLTCELVTIAILHAESRVELEVRTEPDRVRVEVADWGAGVPRVLPLDPTTTGGRGMALVSSLANEWGSYERDGSKIVWFELQS
jgi:anti-sigma regulatory factor (Ser/Thr protein kinase)